MLIKKGADIAKKTTMKEFKFECLKSVFISEFIVGITTNNTQKKIKKRIIDGFGLMRCFKIMLVN